MAASKPVPSVRDFKKNHSRCKSLTLETVPWENVHTSYIGATLCDGLPIQKRKKD